jgi:hypothetical protein
MKSLESIDLGGLGQFTDKPGGFRVDKYHLDEPWPYIFTTPKLLLRVDQRGPDYVQFDPPGGSILVRRERFQPSPSLVVWVKTANNRAFTNFYRPTVGYPLASEPDEFCCDYTPARAKYHVRQDGIACDTRLSIPRDDAVVVMECEIINMDDSPREIEVLPCMRPHLAAGSLAPWDVPALYQRVGYSNEKNHLFYLELRSPAGLPEMREYAFVLSDIESPDGVEVNAESFVGRGKFDAPEALCDTPMLIDPRKAFAYGKWDKSNSVNGMQGIAAMKKRLRLEPGQAFSFRMVMGRAESETPGVPPSLENIERHGKYLDAEMGIQARRESLRAFDSMTAERRISTPDTAFDRYVNEWLPLQLKWVSMLDRGWPTGMRGVRDNAQDVTALIPLDPDHARRTILNLFSVQRGDGWFPRQYSVKGRLGQHDLRGYVDGGVWVWELLYDYLCFTKDLALLDECAAWLDDDAESTIRDHAVRLIEYYLAPENLGEHGLCLIRDGDWNDSVNRAGLEGRGESVMVSCQVVMMLRQAASVPSLNSQLSTLNSEADRLKQSILTHALNSDGYLNGVFNDDGKWVFSPSDPDGKKRVNVPVNAFGIISGVLDGENAVRVLGMLRSLKQTDGWPLFTPPIGDPPIPKLGRIGQGDLAPGLGENGTPYNHGCHGFFGRAAASMGDGDLLMEILRYMLPYDQTAHPVERAKTAPYGVVNHWKTAPGLEGRGGDCFLSGSISTALRNVYGGMFGIKPTLEGLAIDPVLPSDWQEASVEFQYLGARVRLTCRRDHDSGSVLVDGQEVPPGVISDDFFNGRSRVEVVLSLPES